MIPILYSKDETTFTHHGLGNLIDAIKVSVPEERNGAYELTLQYPITGQWCSRITEGTIIKAKLDDSRGTQLFRIYKSTKPLKGIVTFYAEHISYDLNGLPLAGFNTAGSTPLVAINKALEETPLEHPFSAWSNIATLNATKIKEPCSVRGLLGGQEGSILDVWGGEYEFNNFTVKLHNHRGEDNGVTIEYGKNLTDVKQESNIAECYTHIMPYAVYTRDDGNGNSEEVYVYLTERVLALPGAPSLGHYRAFRYDCSGEFGDDEVPTEAKVRALANRYIAKTDLVTPKVNITVSFVNLADTVEYKNIAPLERVRLCDTVTVKFSKLGISTKAKVIKTVYDVLKERYESVTIGDAKSSFADTVNKQSSDITHIVSRVAQDRSRAAIELENAIAHATAAITGQSGGYVVLNPSEHPQEILILDAQSGGDIEQAVNVWRWNSGGLGHSSSGYDGTYTTAITYDGKIVADFIAAGTLNGTLLRAGSVEANAISSAFKQTIADDISGSASTLRQEFQAADGLLRSAISAVETTLSTDYSTTTEMRSEISQSAEALTIEVNKKVNDSDFGTKITQNFSSVQIAWNNISKYIQFDSGELRIYDSAVTASQKLRSRFNDNGMHFHRDNYYVGKIGTNQWSNDNSHKGLVFDLESQGKYMAFAQKPSSDASAYATMLCFSRANSIYDDYGLHLGCDLIGHGNSLKNTRLDGVVAKYKNARIQGFTGEIPIITSISPAAGGGVTWQESKLRVSNGVVLGWWYYEQPFFVSAETSGPTIVSITFNETIDPQSVVTGDFEIKVNGTNVVINSGSVSTRNNKVVELAVPSISAGDTITVSYTKGSLRGTDGGENAQKVSSFGPNAVNNTIS